MTQDNNNISSHINGITTAAADNNDYSDGIVKPTPDVAMLRFGKFPVPGKKLRSVEVNSKLTRIVI